MKVRDLVKQLELRQWRQMRQRGSHRVFKHPGKRNMREALQLHLEAMAEVGEPIPSPTADVDFVELEPVA